MVLAIIIGFPQAHFYVCDSRMHQIIFDAGKTGLNMRFSHYCISRTLFLDIWKGADRFLHGWLNFCRA